MTQPPVSVFSKERWIMNEGVVKPMKAKIDGTMTPFNRSLGMNEVSDFVRYSKRNVMTKVPTSDIVHI